MLRVIQSRNNSAATSPFVAFERSVQLSVKVRSSIRVIRFKDVEAVVRRSPRLCPHMYSVQVCKIRYSSSSAVLGFGVLRNMYVRTINSDGCLSSYRLSL